MGARRRPSVIAQTLMTFGSNSGGYVLVVITGIVVARVLGPAGKGIMAYAALLLGLFTTFGVGLQASIMRECSEGKAQQLAYGTAIRLLGVTMLPAAALLIVYAAYVPEHASYVYIACAIPFAVYCQTANAILLLNDDVRSTAIQALIPTVGVALFTIPALTVFHGGLNAALTIWALMFLVAAAYTVVRLNAHLPALSLRSTRDVMRGQALFALKSGSTSLAGYLNLRVDVFVVGMLLDPRSLGIYTLAVATGEMMWQVSRPLIWTMVGRIAAAERSQAIALTNMVTRNILAVECVLGAAVFLLAPFAVQLVYGSAYAESATLVRWLMPGLIVYASNGPLSYFLSVKEGQPAKSLSVQLVSVGLCAAISFVAIPRMGVTGAALATTITYCCAMVALAVLYMRQTGGSLRSFTLLQREDIRRFGRLFARLLPASRRIAVAE
jgi:O-antigen/teichoic acid export membrane protein